MAVRRIPRVFFGPVFFPISMENIREDCCENDPMLATSVEDAGDMVASEDNSPSTPELGIRRTELQRLHLLTEDGFE